MVTLQEWSAEACREGLPALTELLHGCVHAGACVNFVMPFERAESEAFWRMKVLPGLEAGERRLLVARRGEEVVGTVQLLLAMPPNQRHRAEVAKMLVHPAARRAGLGRRLMLAAEALAREERRTLLTLDTRAGDAGEFLYRSMGFEVCGTIPGFSRHPVEDRLEAALFLYKFLPAES